MSSSKFLKELVTGSPERKAAREASRRNPSIYRLVMFVLGFLVCAYTLLDKGGNWLLIVLTVVCAAAAYSEVRKYQKLDHTKFD
jgi:fatty acid desaturase